MDANTDTIFMTGASGFIGGRVAELLIYKGYKLHLLQRTPADVQALEQRGARVYKGDLLKPDTIAEAMQGCTHAIHMAAYAKAWAADEQTFYRINYQGGKNVLDEAARQGLKRVLLTSTGGILGASGDGLTDETDQAQLETMTNYERSKAKLEAEIPAYIDKGLEVVTVNPARVFGPGPVDDSNGELKVMLKYLEGSFRFLPGDGSATASYCHVDDVAEGHWLALKNGKSGERYILGGENASYRTFFDTIGELNGNKLKMYAAPIPLIMAFAKLQLAWASISGKKPMITPELVRKYRQNWAFDSSKAVRDLGYSYRPLETCIAQTLDWVKEKGLA